MFTLVVRKILDPPGQKKIHFDKKGFFHAVSAYFVELSKLVIGVVLHLILRVLEITLLLMSSSPVIQRMLYICCGAHVGFIMLVALNDY